MSNILLEMNRTIITDYRPPTATKESQFDSRFTIIKLATERLMIAGEHQVTCACTSRMIFWPTLQHISNIQPNGTAFCYSIRTFYCFEMDLSKLMLILFSLSGINGFFLAGRPTITIRAPAGELIGKIDTLMFDGKSYDVTKFLGIPFGEPPVGQNRFKRPIPKARFTSPYSAMDYGASCLQGQGPGTFPQNVSEDCLFLNIFLPGRGSR